MLWQAIMLLSSKSRRKTFKFWRGYELFKCFFVDDDNV